MERMGFIQETRRVTPPPPAKEIKFAPGCPSCGNGAEFTSSFTCPDCGKAIKAFN